MQRVIKTKILIFAIAFIGIFYFTNDFGIVSIEKTAIVTAVGIDKADDKFEITLQIAVPQASNTTSENQKAVVSQVGATASEAVHLIGNITGWYPKLAFCNLIILGKSMLEDNVYEAIDYFSRTLKVQDSACIAGCEGSAKELLFAATPLDNISSFAIQKILLKNAGMTSDVATVDIKDFSVGYYSKESSSYMPYLKMITLEEKPQESEKSEGGSSSGSSGDTGGSKGSESGSSGSSGGESGSSGSSGGGSGSSGSSGGESGSSGSSGGESGSSGSSGSESGSSGSSGGESGSSGSSGSESGSSGGESGGKSGSKNTVFNAATTLLFKNGKKVGMLNDAETKVFNLLRERVSENAFIVNDIEINDEKIDALLTIMNNKWKVKLTMKDASPVLNVNVRILAKIEDTTSVKKELNLQTYIILPPEISKKAEEDFQKYLESIIDKCKESGCDLFNLDNLLYRYNHKYYAAMSGKIYQNLSLKTDITVRGII